MLPTPRNSALAATRGRNPVYVLNILRTLPTLRLSTLSVSYAATPAANVLIQDGDVQRGEPVPICACHDD